MNESPMHNHAFFSAIGRWVPLARFRDSRHDGVWRLGPSTVGRRWGYAWLLALLATLIFLMGGTQVAHAESPTPFRQFLPFTIIPSAGCTPTGASYETISVIPPPTDRPAAEHPDLNLRLRGYTPSSASADYLWINGPTDPHAPLLSTLFAPARRPGIEKAWRIYDWDWARGQRSEPIQDPPVTLISLDVRPGETLHLPDSGYDLGQGFEALVLYAETHRITLKYTREDNVIWGYTLHLENVCVDPNLLALYRAMDQAGRQQLPALRPGQSFARAEETPLGLAIRDTGRFMDPRSIKDWWQ